MHSSPLALESGPRERLARDGPEVLSDAELLAVLLGTGRRGEPVAVLAASLLHDVGGIRPLAHRGLGSLAARSGVGTAKAARVLAAMELGQRSAVRAAWVDELVLPNSVAVASWANGRLAHLEHEELWVLALDGRHRLRAARRVAQGGLHGLSIAPRDVLRVALREAASAFVVVHNHPSGDPAPSTEDLDFTRRLAIAADAIGVPLLDHVVVAEEGHVSLLDNGAIPALRSEPKKTRAPPGRRASPAK